MLVRTEGPISMVIKAAASDVPYCLDFRTTELTSQPHPQTHMLPGDCLKENFILVSSAPWTNNLGTIWGYDSTSSANTRTPTQINKAAITSRVHGFKCILRRTTPACSLWRGQKAAPRGQQHQPHVHCQQNYSCQGFCGPLLPGRRCI